MTQPLPADVLVRHSMEGVGQQISHVVSIRDHERGLLLAEFEGSKPAAQWLKERDYHYVMGSNGEWTR